MSLREKIAKAIADARMAFDDSAVHPPYYFYADAILPIIRAESQRNEEWAVRFGARYAVGHDQTTALGEIDDLAVAAWKTGTKEKWEE